MAISASNKSNDIKISFTEIEDDELEVEKIDEEEFDDIVEQQRHEELMASLKFISENLAKIDKGDEIRKWIQEAIAASNKIGDKIGSIASQKIVVPDNSKVILAGLRETIFELKTVLLSIETKLLHKPVEFTHEVKRDSAGFINQIISKPIYK